MNKDNLGTDATHSCAQTYYLQLLKNDAYLVSVTLRIVRGCSVS